MIIIASFLSGIVASIFFGCIGLPILVSRKLPR